MDDITVDGNYLGSGLVGRIVWTNKGRSPAINVRVNRSFAVVAADSQFPTLTFDSDNNSSGFLGINSSLMASEFILLGNDADGFLDSRKQVALHTYVIYSTAIHPGVERRSDASFEIWYSGEIQIIDGRKQLQTYKRTAGDFNKVN